MSVLIKGFRMPENCLKCPMQFGGWCYVAPPEIDERVAPTVDDAVEQGKPEWCPLVDLGKHGRLIDENEVRTVMNWLLTQPQRPTWNDLYHAIQEMNAVIEAEGEG